MNIVCCSFPAAKDFILVRDGRRWILPKSKSSLENEATGQVEFVHCSLSRALVALLLCINELSFHPLLLFDFFFY